MTPGCGDAAGHWIDDEGERLLWLREAVIEELRERVPSTTRERDGRAAALVTWGIACGASPAALLRVVDGLVREFEQ